MWEGVDNPNHTDGMTWLVDGMKSNTITWCTDGSYHRKCVPKMSGAGWIAYCTKTDNRMTGKFLKILDDAGSYRIENWACAQSITSSQHSACSATSNTGTPQLIVTTLSSDIQ